jgi:hypothetical protein
MTGSFVHGGLLKVPRRARKYIFSILSSVETEAPPWFVSHEPHFTANFTKPRQYAL